MRLSGEPLDSAPGALLTRGALEPSAVWLEWVPEGDREDAHDGLDNRDPRPDVTHRTGDDCCSGLTMSGGVDGFVALGVMTIDKRVVFEGVVDLDRRGLEQCPFSVLVLARRHNIASMFTARSRYASADRDRRACWRTETPSPGASATRTDLGIGGSMTVSPWVS